MNENLKKTKTTIGERIKKVRKYTKLTQKDFAESLGVTQATISGIEKDIANPSLTLVKLICLKYRIDEDWLTNDVGDMLYFPKAWGPESPESFISKYEAMRILLEEKLKKYSADRKQFYFVVESFSYFTSILSATKLTTSNISSYLKVIYDLVDCLEKYTFRCSMLEKRKNIDYETMYELKMEENRVKKVICECIEQITEIYQKNAIKS